jgi:hypothetical protein
MRQFAHGVFFFHAMCDNEQSCFLTSLKIDSFPHGEQFPASNRQGSHMNKLTWIGIIVWGLFVAGFGLTGVSAPRHSVNVQPQDVLFLIVGGMVTCLIGTVGLFGLMGWMPGMRGEQKSYL